MPFPFGELLLHLITQVNDSYLAAYTTVFDLRRDKRRCFIPFLFYALVFPSTTSNLVTLATLSSWYNYVFMHTCSPFLRKNPIEVTQDGWNQATNKLVAGVNVIGVISTP